MPPSVQPCRASGVDGLSIQRTDDGSLTIVDTATGLSYHSRCGAMAETRHVYLENSGVAASLRQRREVRVLEVGLGSGMAFVQTAGEAIDAGGSLQYLALEHRLLPAEIIEALSPAQWTRHAAVVTGFLAARRRWPQDPAPGHYAAQISPRVHLQVIIGDACHWQPAGISPVDAVYFDPFGPRDTPQLWQPDLLRRMFDLLRPEGRLVSYCVSGEVRRRLCEIGFLVHRVPGPPHGKRQVLIAEKRGRG